MAKTKITAKVKSVTLFDGEKPDVAIKLDKEFMGMKNIDDGRMEMEVNQFSVKASYLTGVLCDMSDEFAEFRGVIGHRLNNSQFTVALQGATISIEREKHIAGEEFEGETLEEDGYYTNVVAIQLTQRNLDRMDNIIMALALR